MMTIFDITEERHPVAISTFQVPEEPGDFCHRGGRFGPHSFADAYNPAFDKKLVVLAYFNAGVRVVDIRNPFVPVEVARYIPEMTANTTESCIEIGGDARVQARDPDQQREPRRPRLHLRARPRVDGAAHPRAHGRGARDRGALTRPSRPRGRRGPGRPRCSRRSIASL